MKTITFLGTSLDDIRNFPELARNEAGYQLNKVQQGLDPDSWKPISSIGLGVKEIRIRKEGIYRVIYLAKYAETVYVIHAFTKKTQKTEQKDINLAKERIKLIPIK